MNKWPPISDNSNPNRSLGGSMYSYNAQILGHVWMYCVQVPQCIVKKIERDLQNTATTWKNSLRWWMSIFCPCSSGFIVAMHCYGLIKLYISGMICWIFEHLMISQLGVKQSWGKREISIMYTYNWIYFHNSTEHKTTVMWTWIFTVIEIYQI